MPKLKFKSKPSSAIFIGLFIIALFLVLFFSRRVFFVPKIMVLCLSLVVAAAVGRLKVFLKDWFLFIAFVYLFDSLRGSIFILTCNLGLPVYTLYVIKAETFLFGAVPSVVLQDWLLKSGSAMQLGWFEKFVTVAHGSHFVAFLIVGLVIWLYRTSHFRFFKVSFYLVIFFGLLGYLAVPTVPPWMAANVFGLIPRLFRFNAVIYNMVIPDITSGFDTNPIAAMPSLHAAFPILLGLVLWRIFRWKASPFFLYVFLMLFAIVYTGDHYVVDVLAGGLLAALCYSAAVRITEKDFEHKESIPDPRATGAKDGAKLLRSLVGGLVILGVGVGIGSYNRDQFVTRRLAYTLYSPRYVDFFKKESEFRSSFRVQMYLGTHLFFRKDVRSALIHYETALKIARDDEEKKRAQAGVEECRKILGEGAGKRS